MTRTRPGVCGLRRALDGWRWPIDGAVVSARVQNKSLSIAASRHASVLLPDVSWRFV